ncbi:MAG: fused MFS/spermidine synthase [Pseudomonadota bacterium]
MNTITAVGTNQTGERQGSRAILPIYTATIFLSAFMLFSIQPFFAKMVLPILGGAPSVWSVAMVFFQAVLLAGYGYAHLITTRLGLRSAAMMHAAVMLTAFIVLPISIPEGWTEPPNSGQAYWLLGLFTIAVGLPFFAVSANGPLLQAWFARTGHPHADDPYFLYGASNIGSFASLFLYIVLFEPLLSVSGQSLAWTIGYALLTGSVGICALIVLRRFRAASGQSMTILQDSPAPAIRQKLTWALLAAIPSGLLVAVTAHISMDIAAAPFLWVVPLALFLLTFVFAFARKPVFSINLLSSILPILAALIFLDMVMANLLPTIISLFAHLAFFFFAALLAHSVLVSKRPDASHLTGFYLWMSLGGVLGGAFTTLFAPIAFNWIAEYPLLIIAALLCRPALHGKLDSATRTVAMAGILVALSINNPHFMALLMPDNAAIYAIAISVLALAAAVVVLRSEKAHLFCLALIAGLFFAMQSSGVVLDAQRSFFGVVKAMETADGSHHIMAHGTTSHGAMRIEETESPPEPLAYYHRSGGIASALFAAQEKAAEGPIEVGIVGLGAGSLQCHRRPGEKWTSFEIDQSVVDMASNPQLFRFLSNCDGEGPIIIGDARITLEKQPDAAFDYLLIDAFSSDSIPVHLLTEEALRLYRSKLKQDGILAFHISNRYMELRSLIAALAVRIDMQGYAGRFDRPADSSSNALINASEVAVLVNSEKALGNIAEDPRWQPLVDTGTTPWTDDYSNLLAAILRKSMKSSQ